MADHTAKKQAANTGRKSQEQDKRAQLRPAMRFAPQCIVALRKVIFGPLFGNQGLLGFVHGVRML